MNSMFDINDLKKLTGAEIENGDNYAPVGSVSIDSRKVEPGAMFAAIKGEKFDGHDFVEEVSAGKISALLLNREQKSRFNKINILKIYVDDTTKALGELAAIWRKKAGFKVISITGSNGKTTTKEILYGLFSVRYKTEKTFRNNNNHIGVPLTILGTSKDTEILILEHGTNHFNEIKYTADIALPDYAIITNIGDSHLEYLIDRKGVLKEKWSLAEAAINNGGKVFLNGDDPFLRNKINDIPYNQAVTFGTEDTPDIKGKIENYDEKGYPTIEVASKDKNLRFLSPLQGFSNARNVICAVSLALEFGYIAEEIIEGFRKMEVAEGRLQVVELKDMILIDDSYNANPDSMNAAFDLIGKIKAYEKKILILGDMFELGENSHKKHEEVAAEIAVLKPAMVLLAGDMMKFVHSRLNGEDINVRHFNSSDEVIEYVKGTDLSDSVTLVKGSRGMRMDKIAEVIKGRKRS